MYLAARLVGFSRVYLEGIYLEALPPAIAEALLASEPLGCLAKILIRQRMQKTEDLPGSKQSESCKECRSLAPALACQC